MDKVLYLSFLNEDIRPGYKNKIHSQVSAFSVLKNSSVLLILGHDGLHQYEYEDGKQISLKTIPFFHKRRSTNRNIFDEFFSFHDFCKNALALAEHNVFEVIYVRRIVPITPKLVFLLKKLKKRCKFLVYEYPSIPWKGEMKSAKGIVRKLFYFLDFALYERLIDIPHLIPYIGKYDGHDNRFFHIQNCGSEDMFPCRLPNAVKNEINMIAVAHVSHYHGYDLMIEALKEYYCQPRDIKVYFHVVGNIEGVPELLEMTNKYKLQEYVKFHGFATGKRLDDLYQMADVGINRLRVVENEDELHLGLTTLKTVEYTFRGIPQVSIAPFTIDGNRSDAPEFLLVQKNKVVIEDIVSFMNKLSVTPNEIRNYAIMHMTWKKVFSNMLEYMENIYR